MLAVAMACAAALTHAQSASAKSSSATTTPSAHKSTSRTVSAKKKSRKKKGSWRTRGQQKIDQDRTRQIQEALIRENYLKGEPTGKWDEATQAACRRFQGDNGWQNKTVPDSRLLIKLGLGPGQEHLLNPESAMTSNVASAPASSGAAPTSSSGAATSNGASIPASSGTAGDPPPQ